MRLLILAAGAVILGLALWGISRLPPAEPSPPIPEEGIPPAALEAGPAGSEPPAVTRDPDLDRALTSFPDVFRIYAEGVSALRVSPDQAAASFRRAVQGDPAFAPAHYQLALASVLGSGDDEARTAIGNAMSRGEQLPEPYRTVAPILARYIEGSFDAMAADLPVALARQPGSAELHYLAGRLHADSCEHFDPNGVIEHLERAREAFAGLAAVRQGLIEAYEMKGMHEWSLSRVLEFLAAHPDRIEAIAEVGRARIARREYEDAIEIADEIVRRGGDVFAHGLGPALILTGHHEQAAAMYDPETELTNSAEANQITHLHAGINAVWLGDFGKAVEHFERGPEFLQAPWQRNDRVLFYLLLGEAYSHQGRDEEAHAVFQAAEQVVGAQPILQYLHAAGELRAGNTVEAERLSRSLQNERRASQAGWPEPWRRLLAGEMALAAGDTTRALDEFREAWHLQQPLELDCITGHVEAYFQDALVRGALAARKPSEAFQAADQILSLGVRGLHQPFIQIMALYHGGRAREALGNREEAHSLYRRFLDAWGRKAGSIPEVEDARARLRGASPGEV